MSKVMKWMPVFLLLMSLFYLFLFSDYLDIKRKISSKRNSVESKQAFSSLQTVKEKRSQDFEIKLDPNSRDTKSLKKMVQLLSDSIAPQASMSQFVRNLKKSGLKPTVIKNENPQTGQLHVIRSQKPLFGTRYLHAQYFSNPKEDPFFQSLSFEFRPGLNAFESVVGVLNQQIGLGTPALQSSSFIEWELGGDFILWVKKMKDEDLIGNRYNAYSDADTGTIQVALERSIHGHE